MSRTAGLLLAAGSGRRYGGPKALADTGSGPWVLRALDVLVDCDPRIVVIGAYADQVQALLPPTVIPVRNPDHHTGMASSLRAGLDALPADADAVLVSLVDLPDLTAAVSRRLLAHATSRAVLARASYHGRAGHPVLIGADHLPAVRGSLTDPDAGAGNYLRTAHALAVECGDLASGVDVDSPLPPPD